MIKKLKYALAIVLSLSCFLLHAAVPDADAAAPVYYKDKAIVLMYHDLANLESKSRTATITPSRFGSHLKTLKDNGYNVISIEQFAEFMLNGGQVPDNAVVITFDDGYATFDSMAVPVLKKYGMTAAHFIIGSSSDHNNVESVHLTWDQMRKLKQEGFSFYSHTYDQHHYAPLNKTGTRTGPLLKHRIYSFDRSRQETLGEFTTRITDDLTKMESRLQEELGNTYHMLAFPYGEYNNNTKRIAEDVGIDLFFTTEPGINEAGSDTVYRINAGTPAMSGGLLLKTLRSYH